MQTVLSSGVQLRCLQAAAHRLHRSNILGSTELFPIDPELEGQ